MFLINNKEGKPRMKYYRIGIVILLVLFATTTGYLSVTNHVKDNRIKELESNLLNTIETLSNAINDYDSLHTALLDRYNQLVLESEKINNESR